MLTLLRTISRRSLGFRCMATMTDFPGAKSEVTNSMVFREHYEPMPCYQIMDKEGKVKDESQIPEFTKEKVVEKYTKMQLISQLDDILYNAQRQGRICFYMTSSGEEAIHIGTAAGLTLDDVIYGQYREVGVFLWRGYTIDDVMNQCFATELDYAKGRQMPLHYGSPKANMQTISAPLATQVPQAAGAGYALKLAKSPGCCVGYFGDGASSEGDVHAAMNFAATLQSATLFICRNNGFAISTKTTDQYRGDGVAARGPAYGIPTLRVDGNDLFAVHSATLQARKIVMTGRPALLEIMSYRRGNHSTSDDATWYRSADEIKWWEENNNPITRLRRFLQDRGWWSDVEEAELKKQQRSEVLASLERADKQRKAPITDLFTDVYAEMTPNLQEQMNQLQQHLSRHPTAYDMKHFKPSGPGWPTSS